MAGEKLLFRGS